MKILICGGHPTPALAVVDELRKNHTEIDIVFVGRKYAIESERTLS
ncbi:UDP-N-acetylglucosamine--N-acetylmuramyl-(pentapeptide) pyrophosphoryl-undecaprenol N-acetylglucosamine transferase, partial [Candidatus Roizmanbacteria bacterium CG11_big_fil_rev_8_21_14_0_20_37_16]